MFLSNCNKFHLKNHQMKQRKPLIMVGPDPYGLGGISRVAKLWRDCNLFSDHNVHYIASVRDDDSCISQIIYLQKGLFEFTLSAFIGAPLVYVHTSSYNSFYRKSVFILIAILFRKKVTLHIHPTHFYEFITSAIGLKRWYIFFLLRHIHNFVVLTKEMKKNIQRLFPDKQIYVLSNPVNIEGMAIRKKYERAENRLLYMGWYIKKKGVYDLVDAVEILVRKGIKVHLEFYGTKEIVALKDYIRKKNLISEIEVYGWIRGQKKLEVLHKSTMLILPSHSEGLPNVILEAMATKTPIVATHVGGLREILHDSENALIAEVRNPKDLSDKILKCLEDKRLRKRIAAKGSLDAKTKFDVPIIKAKFKNIIDEVIS